jgi:hypothetical protein
MEATPRNFQPVNILLRRYPRASKIEISVSALARENPGLSIEK